MTLSVTHSFTSAIADDPTAAAAGEVLPSHWNAAHTISGGSPKNVLFFDGSGNLAQGPGDYGVTHAGGWTLGGTDSVRVTSAAASFSAYDDSVAVTTGRLALGSSAVIGFSPNSQWWNGATDTTLSRYAAEVMAVNTHVPTVWGDMLVRNLFFGSVANQQANFCADGNDIIAQRNYNTGTNAQAFRVYNTYSGGGTNYERGVFDWQTTANVLRIGTEKAGTGVARNLEFVVGGTNLFDYGVTTISQWSMFSNTEICLSLASLTQSDFCAFTLQAVTGDQIEFFATGPGHVNGNGHFGIYNPTASTTALDIDSRGLNVTIPAPGSYGWVSNSAFAGGTPDTKISRDAAGILAQQNGTNAQTFRVYNTWSSAGANYERAVFGWGYTANVLTIGTEKSGTGSFRGFQFVAGGNVLLDYNVTSAFIWTLNGGNQNQPFTVTSSGNNGTAFALTNTDTGGHSFQFNSTGSNVGAGKFTVYDATAFAFWLKIDGTTNGNTSIAASAVLGWTNDASGFNATDTGIARNAAGVVEVNNGTAGTFRDIKARTFQPNGVTVATLPTGVAGAVAYVTDGTAALAWGATVTGGGSTKYLVWYNGSNWTVAGK